MSRARRREPACLAQCVGGDVVRLPDGQVVRVLRKYNTGDAWVRGFDPDTRLEDGPEYELPGVTLIQALEWRPTK